jgi:hypothetical protein
MKSTTKTTVKKETGKREKLPGMFEKENFKWMLIGLGVMILGFLLMAGGRSEDPNVFNAGEVYSPVRITVAPILILAGFIIEIVAIFRQPKNS